MTPEIDRLRAIMARLRDPDLGCSWDREQTSHSLLAYTLEEVYELVEAVERQDADDVCDELGDLLFHIVFYARLAEESGQFTFPDIVENVCQKLIRRHPHVFSSRRYQDAEEQRRAWRAIKAEERHLKGRPADEPEGALANVPLALPALLRSRKLLQAAADSGFDWDTREQALEKVDEELAEVRAEVEQGQSDQRLADEIGDLLLAVSNLARHCRIDAEEALRRANSRFAGRFALMEDKVMAERQVLENLSKERLLAFWQQAKRESSPD